MDKTAPTHRWFSAWRAAQPQAQDPADLGTAFGLDLSLNELVHEPTPPSTPATGAAHRGWMSRFTSRRKRPA